MYDSDIRCGIRSVLATLHKQVELYLIADTSTSEGKVMLEVLNKIASCNPYLSVKLINSNGTAESSVRIIIDGQDSGLEFRIIPRGNLLAPFLYALISASGFGFTIDKELLKRAAEISKPINLVTIAGDHSAQTPRIIQIINELAAVNPNISNSVVDSHHSEDLRHRYGIEKIPAVTHNNILISDGWDNVEDIVNTLERLVA